MSSWEKHYTRNDETLSTFKKITILQYFNIAIVSLLINFALDFKPLNAIKILGGEFEDFTTEWYRKIGASLGVTLLLNTFTPHLPKLAIPLYKVTMRCWDRGCR